MQNAHYMTKEFKLQKQDELEIVKLYDKGKKVDKIAERFGVERATVYRVLKRFGLKYRRHGVGKKDRHNALVLEEAQKLQQQGYRVIVLGAGYPIPDVVAIKDGKVYAMDWYGCYS